MSPDTCTNCATHSQWKILDKKRGVTAPSRSTNLPYLRGSVWVSWLVLVTSGDCGVSKVSTPRPAMSILHQIIPTRLYVYPSQYLGLDKRPNDHFIPQTTYLTNLTICTWFTTVNDISQKRTSHKKRKEKLILPSYYCQSLCPLSAVWLSDLATAPAQPTHDMTKVKPRLNNCGISNTRLHDNPWHCQ